MLISMFTPHGEIRYIFIAGCLITRIESVDLLCGPNIDILMMFTFLLIIIN